MRFARVCFFVLLVLVQALAVEAAGPVLESDQDQPFVHAIGREFLPPALTGAAQQINDGYGGRGYDNPNVGWLRDRFPLQVRTREGRLAVVSYLSLLEPSGSPFDASVYLPVRPPADAPAGAKAFGVAGAYRWMEVRTLPLIMEGGNLLALSGRLLVGEKIIRENGMSIDEHVAKYSDPTTRAEAGRRFRGMAAHGFRKRSRDEVLAELARAFEVPVERIRVMPWMPGERTGHVDMYVGVLDAKTVAVPMVPDKLVRDLGYEHERTFASRLNAWLDQRAGELAAFGGGELEVVRLPMVPPKNLVPSGLAEFGFDAQFLTPVNWLLAPGKVFVPSFPEWMGGLPAGEAAAITARIAEVFAARGRQVVTVPATKLLNYNGLVHCLTGQLRLE